MNQRESLAPRGTWLVLFLGLLLLAPAVARGGDPKLEALLEQLSAIHHFPEVSIAQDGKQVAWVESYRAKDLSSHASIYLASAASSQTPRRISAGDGGSSHDEHDIAWSADGKRLAFLSDAEKQGQAQLYVIDAAGGKAKKMTELTGALAQPHWSPDGAKIAFLFTENAPRALGPTQAGTVETGVIGETTFEQRLAILDLATGQVRQVSPADRYVYEFDWAPDGKSLAAIAAHGSGDNNWYIAQLYTLSLTSEEMTSICKPGMQIAMPRWSPDGKNIAFIGGLMSDEGVVGGDIFTIAARGGQPHNWTPGRKASVSWLAWLPGQDILFTELVGGSCRISKLRLSTSQSDVQWTGPETISAGSGRPSLSLAGNGLGSAVVRQSFREAPEVWAGPVGAWEQLTHSNRTAHVSWGEAKDVHWRSDPYDVQGWLIFPKDYSPEKRYPMVVSVHGGPASARTPTWPRTFFDSTILSQFGYFVFCPNPRGSYGQGETYTRANVKDFGYGDLRDILAGVDHVIASYPVDEKRLAVVGWSYGGYMTMWAVTQTNRFRAAVAGAGVANWQSYYGQNGIDQWMIPYFGASVYDDPAVYAKSSPITFIKRVQTPTLVLVGERDLECPVPQSYEFWHGLKTLGVPTQLVVYPNEGHGIAQLDHRRDIMKRMMSWLDKWLR